MGRKANYRMMNKRKLQVVLTIFLTLIVAGFSLAAKAPRNVILMIGDGMGLAQVTYTRLMHDESGSILNMETATHSALVKNQSANSIITDSAAAATALATGCKTNNGMIGMLPDGHKAETILEAAKRLKKSAGLVTNTTITHATPAGFGAHVESRGSEADIAPQYLSTKIDVLMGGGKANFIPKSTPGSGRSDERDLLKEASDAGYKIAFTRDEMLSVSDGKLLGLFEMGYLTTMPPEPSLAEMTSKALDLLSANERGFFLMVEGGQIDTMCHANDAVGMLKQIRDFDEAVEKALQFAQNRDDTLIIITADHETGGLSLVAPEEGSSAKIMARFATKGHSAINVPLFAQGPSSDRFSGVIDNTDIPKIIASIWKIKGFPRTYK